MLTVKRRARATLPPPKHDGSAPREPTPAQCSGRRLGQARRSRDARHNARHTPPGMCMCMLLPPCMAARGPCQYAPGSLFPTYVGHGGWLAVLSRPSPAHVHALLSRSLELAHPAAPCNPLELAHPATLCNSLGLSARRRPGCYRTLRPRAAIARCRTLRPCSAIARCVLALLSHAAAARCYRVPLTRGRWRR